MAVDEIAGPKATVRATRNAVFGVACRTCPLRARHTAIAGLSLRRLINLDLHRHDCGLVIA